MQALLSPPPETELDPATQAICDEVCGALEWFDGSEGAIEYLIAQQFRTKWLVALRSTPDAGCRDRILAACDAIVRGDPGLFISTSGWIFPDAQIGEHRGRLVYERHGERMRHVLYWPSGVYASGEPCYGREAK